MDAVLQDHQQNMARIPLHRKTNNVPLDEFDSRFIKHNQVIEMTCQMCKNASN